MLSNKLLLVTDKKTTANTWTGHVVAVLAWNEDLHGYSIGYDPDNASSFLSPLLETVYSGWSITAIVIAFVPGNYLMFEWGFHNPAISSDEDVEAPYKLPGLKTLTLTTKDGSSSYVLNNAADYYGGTGTFDFYGLEEGGDGALINWITTNMDKLVNETGVQATFDITLEWE